jgi:hypothetical protein
MKQFVLQASKHGVPKDRVFFLVISFRIGLDNEHVKKLMGFDISNKELLENRKHLETYAHRYVDGAQSYLINPHQQIYFLVLIDFTQIFGKRRVRVDLENYEWLHPLVSNLIEKIKEL